MKKHIPKKGSSKNRMDELLARQKVSFMSLDIRIQKDLRAKVEVYCAEHDMTVQEFVEMAVSEKLAKK